MCCKISVILSFFCNFAKSQNSIKKLVGRVEERSSLESIPKQLIFRPYLKIIHNSNID